VGDELLATRWDKVGKTERLDWYRWSDRTLLGSIPAAYPLKGWLTHAPRIFGRDASALAAIVWVGQSEGGIELYRRGEAGWAQEKRLGYWQNACNYVSDVVYSNDGRYLALAMGAPDSWDKRPKKYAGAVIVFDARAGSHQFLDLFAEVAPGWTQSHKDSPVPQVVAFEGLDRLRVRLQNGQELALRGVPGAFGWFETPSTGG
jgi:hypothetical protein